MSYRIMAWNAVNLNSLVKFILVAAILLMIAASASADSYCNNNVCDVNVGENSYNCLNDCPFNSGNGNGGSYDGGYSNGGYPNYGYEFCNVETPYTGYVGESQPIYVTYNGYGWPADAKIECGDGKTTYAYYQYGTNFAVGYCNYRLGGSQHIYVTTGGAYCDTATYIEDYSGDYDVCGDGTCSDAEYYSGLCTADCRPNNNHPTPTATVSPTPAPAASCGLTLAPGNIQVNQYSIVTAKYYNLRNAPNVISVDCGNGATATATDCTGTTGSCRAACYYNSQGTFLPAATVNNGNNNPVSCASGQVTVSGSNLPVTCSTDAQCGVDGNYGVAYCNGNNVVQDFKDYSCSNPGQSNSDCTVATSARVVQACAYGCQAGSCKAQPPAASCAITTNPSNLQTGESTVATVHYYNLNAAPNSIAVDCGNGQASVNAVNCQGTTGTCSASCNYQTSGNPVLSASAGSTPCAPASVRVQSPSSPVPVTYFNDGTYTLNLGDRIIANNQYAVQLNDITNGGQARMSIWDRTHTQIVATPLFSQYTSQEFSAAGNLQVSVGTISTYGKFAIVTVHSPAVTPTVTVTATPTVTASPLPACALSPLPQNVQKGGSSNVIVNYYNLARSPNTIAVDCGNGLPANALNCIGTTGSCSASCYYANAGSFTASAIAAGTACAPTPISVSATPVQTCSDGTAYGQCSNNKPYVCDSGFLVKDAALCGCPNGQEMQGSQCVNSQGVCSTSVNPYPVRANSPMQVQIAYRNFPATPTQISVLCGNGLTVAASCTPSSETAGTCSATCSYEEQNNYPQSYTVDANVQGVRCASAQAKEIGPLDTTGSILVQATDCKTGAALQNARVSASGGDIAFTDSLGQARIDVTPGTYTVTVAKQDFDSASASKIVTAGKTVGASICLPKSECSLKATLASAPQEGDARSPLRYDIKLENTASSDAVVAATYSAAFNVNGPTSVTVPAKASRIVSLQAYPPVDFTGNSAGMATFTTSECSRSVDLPLHVEGGLSIEVSQPIQDADSGKTCFDFQVRNRGGDQGVVSLTYLGDLDGKFNANQFQIMPYEIRDNLNFCVHTPSGNGGAHSFTLKASSPISDAQTLVTVNVPDADDFNIDAGSCFYVDTDRNMPITISNDGTDGDYAVELQGNNAGASVSPSMLYNFKAGTSRTVYLTANPDAVRYEEHVQLSLKKDGRTVSTQDVCLRNGRYYDYYDGYPYPTYDPYYNGNSNMYDATLRLLQSNLQVASGATGSITAEVDNTGRYTDAYEIDVGSLQGKATPNKMTLRSGESQQTIVEVKGNVAAGTYTVPVRLYSVRRGYYYNNNYVSGGEVNCGNGRTLSVSCSGSSGSCTTSCEYNQVGTSTVTGHVGDTTCENTKVKVISADTMDCQVGVESFARSDSTVAVTVRYNKLNHEPTNGRIDVDCGNGLRVNATGCYGTTGSCGASCYYGDTGTRFVSASTQDMGCGNARVLVNDDGNYCSLEVQPLVIKDRTASIELNYRGVNYDGNNNPVYDPYSGSRVLIDTQNLQVTVGSSNGGGNGQPGTQAPLLTNVVSQAIAESGTAVVSATLYNPNNVPLSNIAITVLGLPSGVRAQPAEPVTLNANEQKTVRVTLKAAQAAPGSSRPVFSVQSGAGSASQSFNLEVIPINDVLDADIDAKNDTTCGADGNPNSLLTTFTVTNNENENIGISGVLKGLPAEWNYVVRPLYQVLKPGEKYDFNVTINMSGNTGKDVPAVFEVRHRDGRRTSLPFDVKVSKCNGSPFAGLVVLNTQFSFVQLLAVLAVIAIALLIYYSARPSGEEDEDPAESEQKRQEHETRMRQLTLASIKEEIKAKPEEQPTWGESAFSQSTETAPEATVDEDDGFKPAA